MPTRKKRILALLVGFLAGASLGAQVPTSNVLFRVFRLKTATGTGSAFTIEVDGKQYLITSRHNLRELGAGGTVELWIGGKWTPFEARAIYPSNNVDVMALDLGKPVTVTFPLAPTSSGLTLGQQVYFLGYPFGMGTGVAPAPAGFGELPFLKSGIISAIDSRNPAANVLYLDGQNNPGFSGGPIVFWHPESAEFRVAGVVKGYRNEALPVLKRKDLGKPEARAHNDLYTRANSGIVIGYDIRHIVDAIRAANRGSRPPAR